MNQEDALKLIQKHGSKRAAARAAGMAKTTFANIADGKTKESGAGRAIPAQPETNETTEIRNVTTFSLRNVAVLSKKPADTMKGRLYSLRKGVGYKIDDMAKEWHVTIDTLQSHAKRHGALGYVEATPGEFIAVLVHPETQKVK